MEKLALVPASIMRGLPAMVRHELVKLPPEKQDEFVEEYRRRKKSAVPAYILWFFLGWHYIYFRKWGLQIIFWLTLGGLFIWWLVDAFRIPSMRRDYNKDIAIDVFRDLKIMSA
jgi:hypothetical protein